ncbi:winged helix-turn-helix transcriptional regulator [Algoriphagus formosus]|uniref:winged helix-turn-helix transcriptional regulator n=1 Tax=Algoriphagus formosus TaxID=2007308 RepID=UPI000C28FA47
MKYTEFENCGLKKSLDMISGKWNPLILYHLFHQGNYRFNELWQTIPKVSKKVLTKHLRQLEENGLIQRKEIQGFPPRTSYNLSNKGKKLGPILKDLDNFGNS